MPVLRSGERRSQNVHLVVAADEAGEAARTRYIEARPRSAHALQFEHSNGIIRPTQFRLAEIAHIEITIDEPLRVLAQVNTIGCCELLDALCETNGVPLSGIVHP